MFELHDFVFQTIFEMIGCEPDYKVRQYALGWMDKGQLTTEDLKLLDDAIKKQYKTDVELMQPV